MELFNFLVREEGNSKVPTRPHTHILLSLSFARKKYGWYIEKKKIKLQIAIVCRTTLLVFNFAISVRQYFSEFYFRYLNRKIREKGIKFRDSS